MSASANGLIQYKPPAGYEYRGYGPYVMPGCEVVMVHRWACGNVIIDMTNEELADRGYRFDPPY